MTVLLGAEAIGAYMGCTGRAVRRWVKEDRTFPVNRFRRRFQADTRSLDAWAKCKTVHASEKSERL